MGPPWVLHYKRLVGMHSAQKQISFLNSRRWLWEEAVQWFYYFASWCFSLRWLVLPLIELEILGVGPLTPLPGPKENALGQVTHLVSIFHYSIFVKDLLDKFFLFFYFINLNHQHIYTSILSLINKWSKYNFFSRVIFWF